jgi:hypothetical protein
MKKLLHTLTSLLLVFSLQAQSVWDGGAATFNWQDAANWNPDGVPAAGALVEIGTSVNISGSVPNIPAQILINGGATVRLDLSMTVGDGVSMYNAIEIAANSRLNIGLSQTITVNAPLTHNGVNIAATADNAILNVNMGANLNIIQALHGIDAVGSNADISNAGTINIDDVAEDGIRLLRNTLKNNNDINITSAGNNGIYMEAGTFSNGGSAELNIEDADNHGILHFSEGTFNNFGMIKITNPGMTTIDGIHSINKNTKFNNTGTITITKPNDDGIEIIESFFENTGKIDLELPTNAGTENVGIALNSNAPTMSADFENNAGRIDIDGGSSTSGRGIYVYSSGNLVNKSNINLSGGDDENRIYDAGGKVFNDLGGIIDLSNGRITIDQGSLRNDGLIESTRGTSGIFAGASTNVRNFGFFDYTGSNDFATGSGTITDVGIDLNDMLEMIIDAGGNCFVHIAQVSYEYFSGATSVGTSDVTGLLNLNNMSVGSDPATLTNSLGVNIIISNFCAAALPIELVYFTASPLDRAIKIAWQTAIEINNDYMAVEKSTDGRTFSEIGRVKGAGFSEELITYELIDPNPARGKNYYRLRQVDFDGTVSYSDIEVVLFDKGTNELELYPTLLSGAQELTISLSQPENTPITFQLLNANGQLIKSYDFSGGGDYPINTTDLHQGMYILRGVGKYNYLVNRFIKLD